MLQYMDKLALSQATLFNLTQDLVSFPFLPPFSDSTIGSNVTSSALSISRAKNIIGRRQSSISDISPGAGLVPTSSFASLWENI